MLRESNITKLAGPELGVTVGDIVKGKRCWNCQKWDTMTEITGSRGMKFLQCMECGATANIGDPEWTPPKPDTRPVKRITLRSKKK